MPCMPAAFCERLNRFVARVRLPDGRLETVHIASSGRMVELLVPGAPAIVDLEGPRNGRKTGGRLLMVQSGDTWVSVDTSLPERLFRRAVAERRLLPFADYAEVRPEYPYGNSRIDFLLTGPGMPPCLVEVKSVTTAIPDSHGVKVARFPDAPTARGARHMQELSAARLQGYRSAVCFIIQRDDAEAFGPYEAIDPAFSAALRAAAAGGVEVHALKMQVSPAFVGLGGSVPLRLHG